MHHWGREWLAVEATAACGGNREPEQAQRSQRTSPAQGVQADAVTASRRPAVRPAGQKQSSGRFLERGRVPGNVAGVERRGDGERQGLEIKKVQVCKSVYGNNKFDGSLLRNF